jgi:hypothetical protein
MSAIKHKRHFFRLTKLLSSSLVFLSAFTVFAGDLPIIEMTPGAVNPAVNQDNLKVTVCVKGFTKTIRPRVSYTNQLKLKQIEKYAYVDINPMDYEEDHLIPLSLGGSPDNPLNLWPQPIYSKWSASRKDQLELELHRLVCRGDLRLRDAQQEISLDWIQAYRKYIR